MKLQPTLFIAIFATAASAWSQTADRTSTDEPVTLSPFEVRATDTTGYLAAESTTGTRYAAPNLEIPFPVNVVTGEFIENFLAFDFSDAVAYTSSTGVSGGTAAFNLRGIRNNTQYKNGIREGGLYAPIDLDRIEIIKGANAAIYGQTEPAGLRNLVTKTANPRPLEALYLNLGTDSFRRIAFDVNQPLIKGKLYTRFAGSAETSKQYVQDFASFWRNALYNSTVWRIGPNTSLTTHWEYIKFRSHQQGVANLPFILSPTTVNGVATTAVTGILGDSGTERFRHLNYAGPFGYNQVEYNQLDATLQHKFNDVFSLRVLGSHWNRPSDIVRPNATTSVPKGTPSATATMYNAATGQLIGLINPRLEKNREFGVATQADLLSQFTTGPIKHKFLVTADYFIDRADARRRTSSRSDAPFDLTNVFTNHLFYNATFPLAFDYDNTAVWNGENLSQKTQTVIKGLMASERAGLFNDRLLLMAGVRHDESRVSRVDRLSDTTINGVLIPKGNVADFQQDQANSPQFAALYQVKKGLSAYASVSRSFNVQSSNGTGSNIDVEGNPLPVQRGAGQEFGIKGALLDSRLNFTFGYYNIDKQNIPRVALDAAGNRLTIPGLTPGTTRNYSTLVDENSHGLELDLNWRFTDDFSVIGGAGWNHARYTKVANATEQYLKGIPPDSAPTWGGGLAAEYKLSSGRFRGLSARLGWRYQGTQLVNTSTASIYGNSGVKGPPITIGGVVYNTYYFDNHAYSLVDLGLAYSWKSGRWQHRVSLDVKNLLDEYYLNIQAPGMPRSVNISYDLKH